MNNMDTRIGFGYDLHVLTNGESLMLGGVKIPYEKGLKGHSDADVLLHAITDALLGSLSLGDIGSHYPDTDPKWKNADSRRLLAECYEKVRGQGYELGNLDVTLIAEEPKLKPYVDQIRESISKILETKKERVSVKATTNEKLGHLGRGEGIAVHAVVLVKKVK